MQDINIDIIPTANSELRRKAHVILWGGIYHLIDITGDVVKKSDIFNILQIPTKKQPKDFCYACQEAEERYDIVINNNPDLYGKIHKCYFCPLGDDFCSDGHEYMMWEDATKEGDYESALQYAGEVAEANWK